MNLGLIGAIIGGSIGLAGGIIGTYLSIKKTSSIPERNVMLKASIVLWAGVLLFIVLNALLPRPYQPYIWIPYWILLPVGIAQTNKKLQGIRKENTEP